MHNPFSGKRYVIQFTNKRLKAVKSVPGVHSYSASRPRLEPTFLNICHQLPVTYKPGLLTSELLFLRNQPCVTGFEHRRAVCLTRATRSRGPRRAVLCGNTYLHQQLQPPVVQEVHLAVPALCHLRGERAQAASSGAGRKALEHKSSLISHAMSQPENGFT